MVVTSRKVSPVAIAAGLVIVGLAIVLSASHALASPACRSVRGRVIDQQSSGAHSTGRMIGAIAGTYDVTVGPVIPAGTQEGVVFATSNSVVHTKKGDLTFSETASLDLAETEGLNGVALLTITGGTGDWQGASGHLLLSGYFHGDTGTGEWDYQGEVCLP
jgi:hypothetical protein